MLVAAAGVGSNAIRRETGKSKTCVWRWQERFMAAGVDGLVRDQTRPSRIAPLDQAIIDRVVALTNIGPPRAIRSVGAKLLFLPPYSPDLNPIEQVFAKLKLLLRKAAERTVETTWKRIGSLLDTFTPRECANYLRVEPAATLVTSPSPRRSSRTALR